MNHGLLMSSKNCASCDKPCKLCKRSKNKDGYSWRCPSRKHEFSIRLDSWFEQSHLVLQVKGHPKLLEFFPSYSLLAWSNSQIY